jgi:hypothetical protein
VAGDSHLLRPDHLPTPFSAAEIRAGFVPGREVRSVVIRQGAEPVVRVTHSVAADAEGGEYEVWTETRDGRRLTEPERGRSAWLELQGHASMPAASTTIEDVSIETPAGMFEGRRYTRVGDGSVDTFWFAMSRPGAPVRMESRVGDEVVFASEMIEERQRES